MKTVTQNEALAGLKAFKDEHSDALTWMNVTDCDGLTAHYVGLTKQFTSVQSAFFRIQDGNMIQLDRFRKAQPGYDSYYAYVSVHDGDIYSVRHEAVDWTNNRGESVYSEVLYYDSNGKSVLKAVI